MMLDSPPPAAPPARRAYRTAHYAVSKAEMAGLYRRYYAWVKARELDAQRSPTSIVHITPLSSHRAYQTASYRAAVHYSYAAPTARRAYRAARSHGALHKAMAQGTVHVTSV